MLSVSRLHELLDFDAGGPDVLSVYLELDRSGPGGFRGVLQEAVEREASLAGLRKDLERIEKHLSGFQAGAFRGLALFSASNRGFWEAVPLPHPVRSVLVLDARPYLAPLLSVLDQHQRFGVALVGKATARFLEVHMGRIEECREKHVPVAARPRPRDAARPAIDPTRLRLRALAAEAGFLARKRGWDRFILSAQDGLEPELAAQLPLHLRQNLIVDGSLDPDAEPALVLERVLTNECEARKVRESVLAQRLVDAAATEGPAVLGIEKTLEALQRGLVRSVLIRDGYAKIGRSCTACGALSLADKKCALCAKPTRQLFDLAAELVQEALDQDCEVYRILYDTRLDSVGRIGAELGVPALAAKPAVPPQGSSRPLTIPL